jgi:GTPase involved in cell partitioning and DNA repair
MSNLTGTPSVGKVELTIDATNARRALDDFDFDLLARSLGVSVRQIKSALLTTTLDRTVRYARPPASR